MFNIMYSNGGIEAPYIVNGRGELLEQVQKFLESYYDNISKGKENFPLYVQKLPKDNCLHLKVSEKKH